MVLRTDRIDSDETEVLLAQVASPTSRTDPKSIYVKIPRIDRSRRTDGGAENFGGPNLSMFEEDIDSYERGDHCRLTFEPMEFNDDKHELVKVEKAHVVKPQDSNEPTFPHTDIPKTCPQCGREAAAIVKTEYDTTTTGGKVSDTADMCTVHEENRGSWFGLLGEWSFVHGVEE